MIVVGASSMRVPMAIEMRFSLIDVSLKQLLLIETYRGELACHHPAVNSRQVSLGVDVNPHK